MTEETKAPETVASLADFQAATIYEYKRIAGLKPGQKIVIRSVTAGDMIEWSEANEGEAKRTAGLRLITSSVVDGEPSVDDGAKGVLIMTDKNIGLLRGLQHKITEGIVREILMFNGMNVKDTTSKKD